MPIKWKVNNMSTAILFKNQHGSVNIVLPCGARVSFVDSKFFTTDKSLEKKLAKLAETGDYGVYVDTAEAEVDTDAATPMEALYKKIRAEVMAELNKAPVVNAGNSSQGGIADSVSVTKDSELTGGGTLTAEEEAAKQASTQVGATAASLQAKLQAAQQKS